MDKAWQTPPATGEKEEEEQEEKEKKKKKKKKRRVKRKKDEKVEVNLVAHKSGGSDKESKKGSEKGSDKEEEEKPSSRKSSARSRSRSKSVSSRKSSASRKSRSKSGSSRKSSASRRSRSKSGSSRKSSASRRSRSKSGSIRKSSARERSGSKSGSSKERSDKEDSDSNKSDSEKDDTDKEGGSDSDDDKGRSRSRSKSNSGKSGKEESENEEEEGRSSKRSNSKSDKGSVNDIESEEEEYAPPSRLMTAKTKRSSSWVEREVKRLDEDSVRMTLRGREIVFRIPPDLRDWDPEDEMDAPDDDFDMDWVYGYRGKDSSNNIHILPTGEIAYYIASVIVLYNPEAHSQRFYRGHTNDVECLALHPDKYVCASGQAEGHDNVGVNQSAHVQVWNCDDLELLHIVGLDYYKSSIASVALSSVDSKKDCFYMAVLDSDTKPVLSLWKLSEDTTRYRRLTKAVAHSDYVKSINFLPDEPYHLITTGKGHVALWSHENRVLEKKQGLFTRKIERPQFVECSAFAVSGDILTGDSDGNVMVWKLVKVVRVLKGAHSGPVADICVVDDGAFVSGGLEDGCLVVFDDNYQLIGAGATLPERFGSVRRIQCRSFSKDDNGNRFFHMLVGTTANCIVDVSFKVGVDSTDILDLEFESLVQGHQNDIRDLVEVPETEKFLSGGDDKVLILWDSVAHKAIWGKSLEAAVTSIAVTQDGETFSVGMENGELYLFDMETKKMDRIWKCDEAISCLEFSPQNRKEDSYLAVGAKDNKIHIFKYDDSDHELKRRMEFEGHSSHVKHIDWSKNGQNFRSNSADYELLFWDIKDKKQVVDPKEIDEIPSWDNQTCTLTFETLGIWPRIADGTDINVCHAADDLVAVGDDFGRVNLYAYPAVNPKADSKEFFGHSAHVTGITFINGNKRLVSAGGREASLIQWNASGGT